MVNTFWIHSLGCFVDVQPFVPYELHRKFPSQNRKHRFGHLQFQTIHVVIDTSMDHRYCNMSNPIQKSGIRMPSTGSRHSISASTTPSMATYPNQDLLDFPPRNRETTTATTKRYWREDMQQFVSCHAQMLHVWYIYVHLP